MANITAMTDRGRPPTPCFLFLDGVTSGVNDFTVLLLLTVGYNLLRVCLHVSVDFPILLQMFSAFFVLSLVFA